VLVYLVSVLPELPVGASMHAGPNLLRYNKNNTNFDDIGEAPRSRLHTDSIEADIEYFDSVADEVNLMQSWIIERQPDWNGTAWQPLPVSMPAFNLTLKVPQRASQAASDGGAFKLDARAANISVVVPADASMSLWDTLDDQSTWKQLDPPFPVHAAPMHVVDIQIFDALQTRDVCLVSTGVILSVCTTLVVLVWALARNQLVRGDIVKPALFVVAGDSDGPSVSLLAHPAFVNCTDQKTDTTRCDCHARPVQHTTNLSGDESEVRPNFSGRWVLARVEGNMDNLLKESGACLRSRIAQRMKNYGIGHQVYEIVQEGNAIQMAIGKEVMRFLAEGGEQYVGTSRSTIVDPRWKGQTLTISKRCQNQMVEASKILTWTFKDEHIELDVSTPCGIQVRQVFSRC